MTHVTQPGAHHSVEICLDVEHNAQKEDRERQEGRGKKESPAGGGREDVPRFRKRLRSIFLLASESDEPASQPERYSLRTPTLRKGMGTKLKNLLCHNQENQGETGRLICG